MADIIDLAAEIIEDELQRRISQARHHADAGESLTWCEDCGARIPAKRRLLIPGVRADALLMAARAPLWI